jgi:hypothetical protein
VADERKRYLCLVPEPRRFPPPWSVDDPDTKLGQDCYVVRDANGHPLTYVYFEEERGRLMRSTALSACLFHRGKDRREPLLGGRKPRALVAPLGVNKVVAGTPLRHAVSLSS